MVYIRSTEDVITNILETFIYLQLGTVLAQHSRQYQRTKMILYSFWSSSSDPANLKFHAAITSLTWLSWKVDFSTVDHYGLLVLLLHRRCSDVCDYSDLYKHAVGN